MAIGRFAADRAAGGGECVAAELPRATTLVASAGDGPSLSPEQPGKARAAVSSMASMINRLLMMCFLRRGYSPRSSRRLTV